MAGYVKIHRKLLDWGWYKVPCVKDVFIHLVLTANYSPSEYQGKLIERGQAVFGLNSLAEKLGYSVQQIRTAIDKLKSTKEISVWSNRHFSVATITNFAEYQDASCDGDNQQTNNKQTTDKQQTDNKQITNNQQTDNNIIRNKEEKKERNIYTARARVCAGEFVSLFNKICQDLPKVKAYNGKREMLIDGALELLQEYETEPEAFFKRIQRSDYLCGRKSDWRASFDWLVMPGNIVKIIEGNYDNPPPKPPKGGAMFSAQGGSFDVAELEDRGLFD